MSLRPTFLGFESMRRSITAAQKGLDITGNNIANMKTVGYSRQRVDYMSINTPGGSLKYKTAVSLAGQGVNIPGVTQLRDPILDMRYRNINSETAEAGTKAGVLTSIQDVLDVIGNGEKGFDKAYKDFIAGLNSYTSDNADRVEIANVAIENAKQVVNILRDYSYRLDKVQSDTKFEIESGVDRVSSIFQEIANLNTAIKNSYISSNDIFVSGSEYKVNSTYGPNELKDERNRLLDELSNYGNMDITEKDDGTIKLTFGNRLVVDGDYHVQLGCSVDENTGAMEIYTSTGDQKMQKLEPTYDGLNTGAFKAYLEMFNGAGVFVGDATVPHTTDPSGEPEGIPYYRKLIDSLAATFAGAFNEAVKDPNATADQNAERVMFASKDGGPITAANITIADQWKNDHEMIAKTEAQRQNEAAGSPDTDYDGLSTEMLNRLCAVENKNYNFGLDFDAVNGTVPDPNYAKVMNGKFSEYISNWSNLLGKTIESETNIYEAKDISANEILTNRDSVMGVDFNEEGIMMTNYQKWFSASSRMMTVMDEALDTIINSMGLVGR